MICDALFSLGHAVPSAALSLAQVDRLEAQLAAGDINGSHHAPAVASGGRSLPARRKASHSHRRRRDTTSEPPMGRTTSGMTVPLAQIDAGELYELDFETK